MPITQYRKLSYRSTGGIGLLGMNEAQRRVLGTVDTLLFATRSAEVALCLCWRRLQVAVDDHHSKQ
ncbi:MAG: hypothetical protein ACXW6V_23500 [Candidatus Binatia bacterium]